MIGLRVYSKEPHELLPGEYGRWERDGKMYARTPNGHLGNLSAHDLVEHDDGTVTASPSILVTGGDDVELWHGFLERGVWRTA